MKVLYESTATASDGREGEAATRTAVPAETKGTQPVGIGPRA